MKRSENFCRELLHVLVSEPIQPGLRLQPQCVFARWGNTFTKNNQSLYAWSVISNFASSLSFNHTSWSFFCFVLFMPSFLPILRIANHVSGSETKVWTKQTQSKHKDQRNNKKATVSEAGVREKATHGGPSVAAFAPALPSVGSFRAHCFWCVRQFALETWVRECFFIYI